MSAIGAASLPAQARPDNEYQSRARQQLREAMGDLKGVPPTNAAPTQPQPVKTAPVTPAVKPMPTPTPTQPVVKMPAPTPAQPVVKMPTPTSEQPVIIVKTPAPTPTPAVVKPVVTTQIQPMPTPAKKPMGLSPEAEMRAREAVRQAELQLDGQVSATSVPPPRTMEPRVAATTPPVKREIPTAIPSAMPARLVAPPTNLSGSKEQRLGQLLQQYKADQITPAQYHEQRAKILAEP
ncbi:MAG TPA: hypothetical protein VH598_04920 [Verrucomicrobiae bacterium]|nr:hypothetical protein [Verrucomicrobiae bacterium]